MQAEISRFVSMIPRRERIICYGRVEFEDEGGEGALMCFKSERIDYFGGRECIYELGN